MKDDNFEEKNIGSKKRASNIFRYLALIYNIVCTNEKKEPKC